MYIYIYLYIYIYIYIYIYVYGQIIDFFLTWKGVIWEYVPLLTTIPVMVEMRSS